MGLVHSVILASNSTERVQLAKDSVSSTFSLVFCIFWGPNVLSDPHPFPCCRYNSLFSCLTQFQALPCNPFSLLPKQDFYQNDILPFVFQPQYVILMIQLVKNGGVSFSGLIPTVEGSICLVLQSRLPAECSATCACLHLRELMCPRLVPMISGWLNAAGPGIHEWDSVAWVGASAWFVPRTVTALVCCFTICLGSQFLAAAVAYIVPWALKIG